MVLRRLGVLSVGVVMGVIYTALGLLLGVFFSLFAMINLMIGKGEMHGPAAIAIAVFAVVGFPIFYGFTGFIGGVVLAAMYNLVASFTGGIKMELTPE